MLDAWTGDVVGRCHVAGISHTELAARAGLSAPYVSMVLNGQKGNDATRDKLLAALAEMESEKPSNG